MEYKKPNKPPIETVLPFGELGRQIEIARITGNRSAAATAIAALKDRTAKK